MIHLHLHIYMDGVIHRTVSFRVDSKDNTETVTMQDTLSSDPIHLASGDNLNVELMNIQVIEQFDIRRAKSMST